MRRHAWRFILAMVETMEKLDGPSEEIEPETIRAAETIFQFFKQRFEFKSQRFKCI
jgi:hypothetical protein